MTDETSLLSSEEPEGPMLVAGDNPGSADAYLLLLPDEDPPAPQRPAPFEDSTLHAAELPEPAGRRLGRPERDRLIA
jgi:hypothetical protein